MYCFVNKCIFLPASTSPTPLRHHISPPGQFRRPNTHHGRWAILRADHWDQSSLICRFLKISNIKTFVKFIFLLISVLHIVRKMLTLSSPQPPRKRTKWRRMKAESNKTPQNLCSSSKQFLKMKKVHKSSKSYKYG